MDNFMDNYKLDAVTEENDLGILITITLSQPASASKHMLKPVKHLELLLEQFTRLHMFCWDSINLWYVFPHLEYCVVPAWSPHYKKDKLLLERVQHRFTKMVPGLRQLAYKQRLKRFGLWNVDPRETT